ncbi:hypothetical protein BGX38DRAFT_1276825 [Terfezia claveryi]|nr:hypothetical protein BGX38DRAFT_1276825 [Terfezia claveryi]
MKDSLDAVLRELLVTKACYENWEQLRVCVKSNECNWEALIEEVDSLLEYYYIPLARAKKDEEYDRVFENILLFTRQELEFQAYYKATRLGDVGAMEYLLQFLGPQFLGSNHSKYANALMEIRVGMAAEWSEELKEVVRANWVINPWGKRGKFLGLDEFMKELIRAYKQQYNPEALENLDEYMRKVIAHYIVYFMQVKEDMRHAIGLRQHSGNHVKSDRSPDVRALLDDLLDKKWLIEVKGRGKPDEGEGFVGHPEVRDMMEASLVKMMDGQWWGSFLARSLGCICIMKIDEMLLGISEQDIMEVDLRDMEE